MNVLKTLLSSVLIAAGLISANGQIFYKIDGNGLSKPSYIFGTHHLAPLKVIENGVMDRFAETEQVVGEIDLTGDQMMMALSMQQYMIAPADSALSMVISPEDYAVISEEFKKWAPMPGMELQMLDVMKPMTVSTIATVKMMTDLLDGFNPEQQLDKYFQETAKAEGKAIVPLETAEFQAQVLYASTPIKYQAESLVELLKNPEEAIENMKKLNAAYDSHDLDAMYALTEENDQHPEFMEALLDKRNADWLSKLPAIMQEAPSFIAVGALHLAGDKGLVEGLRKLGFSVTPIEIK